MRIFKIAQSENIHEKIENDKAFLFFKRFKDRITWKQDRQEWLQHGQKNLMNFYGTISTENVGAIVPSYMISIDVEKNEDKYTNASIKLFFNKLMTSNMQKMEMVGNWLITGDEEIRNTLKDYMSDVFNLSTLELPHIYTEKAEKKKEQYLNKRVRLTRAKSSLRNIEAQAVEIYVTPIPSGITVGHDIYYQVTQLEKGIVGEPVKIASSHELNAQQALEILESNIESFKRRGYVDSTSIWYIPKDVTPETFNFDLNLWKKDLLTQQESATNDFDDILSKSVSSYKTAQNFEGYFTGNVPDYATQFLGTSSVEASQIQSMFGKASEAVNLVNQFDSSLLYNISFIFNFAKSGAYGVYLGELDRAIKTKALQKKLEQKGYQVKTTDQGLTAYPKEGNEITPEAIQQDIDNIYSDLQSKGGTAIGINMSAVLNAAKSDALESGSKDPEMWQWIAVLHLGGTIAHEAIHAKGSTNEGPSEQIEQSFTEWALPKINDAYKTSLEGQGKGEEFTPLMVTNRQRHANSKTWYKTAQLSYYVPKAFTEDAIGSDLKGRHPVGLHSEMGFAEWSMLAQEGGSIPLEKKLGRQYMSPLPHDLSQEHNSIEEQLRKYTRRDEKLDPNASMELLLSEGWDEDRGFLTTEGLLDEKRPKPLLTPLKKAASKLTKTATLFGWMNNLDYSDGSTIPGLGDRVMAWEDRDESFSAEEDWIKQQPRYNPTYDIKGFYYRWIEPHFAPQLFDDMTRDYSNTHPAKRFASAKIDSELARILSVLAKAKKGIRNGRIISTRFILTEDVMPVIDKIFSDNEFKISVFHYGETDTKEEIYAVWISTPNTDEDSIERAEKHLQNKTIEKDVDTLLDGLTGISKQRSGSIQEIIDIVKDICQSYNVNDLAIVGAYPRDVAMKTTPYLIDSLEFRGSETDQCLKIGSLIAEKMGIDNVKMGHSSISFVYKNVSISFSGDTLPIEIKTELKHQGVDIESANVDLYNRDFTVNMLSYNLMDSKITDPTGKASEDVKNKIIRTSFDPYYVCQQNPIIILRALKLKIRHNMEIDPILQKAMMDNASLIFDGRYSDVELIIARENVKKEGNKEASELFKVFKLENIEKVS